MNTKKSDIFKVLETVFSGTNVRYSVVDKKIILSAEPASVSVVQQNKKTVSGVVKDENGEPVIGANVVENNQRNGDEYGWQIHIDGFTGKQFADLLYRF